MNSLKKNLAKQGSSKKNRRIKVGAALVILAAVLLVIWYKMPVYRAKFYLTRSALETKTKVMKLWQQDEGEGEGYEDSLKLVADEVRWNGHSVLLLPGGLGISFSEQRNHDNTLASGALNVYFLGSIREGITYTADQDHVVFHIPGITEASAQASQDSLENTVGFTVTPQKKSQIHDRIKTIEKDTIKLISQSSIHFSGRKGSAVMIEAEVASEEFDAYLGEIGGYLLEGPLKGMKMWGEMLKERKTPGQFQKITFVIDKSSNLSEVHVEGLLDLAMLLEDHGGLSLKGNADCDGRAFTLDTKLNFGNGEKGKRSFQISRLNITSRNEKFDLDLELSGGYQGGRIPASAMAQNQLDPAGGDPGQDGILHAKNRFLEKVKILGFDLKEKNIY
ncbi:hypothetical protein [Clostridium sp. HBUAS56010]|uniref:hypothetical protein n=1 Tax=Clostridium sp. HBUAS56010 TaxID=2571127 RepID=UPI001178C9F4|nr:hypothetical protein [Clostridium sp. HBUAS56010]